MVSDPRVIRLLAAVDGYLGAPRRPACGMVALPAGCRLFGSWIKSGRTADSGFAPRPAVKMQRLRSLKRTQGLKPLIHRGGRCRWPTLTRA
jgi:hypothetical protein